MTPDRQPPHNASLEELAAKADLCYQQDDKLEAARLVDGILKLDFTHPAAWRLLYHWYGSGKPFRMFQLSFARKYYPAQLNLLAKHVPAVHLPALLPPEPQKEYPVTGSQGRNWALGFGILIVLLIFVLMFLGPRLAPHDPMQENYIFLSGKLVFHPPLAAFTLPEYPLGSDEFGRDVLSRLLYAIQPTMNLVLVVAGLRLLLGTLIGILSGWFDNIFGKTLDGLISAALSVPVLFVALCIMAVTGQAWGLWAFVLGLSITGWAETARMVREQTRITKQQPFIEAAVAMGASNLQNLRRHVVPQVLPMVWTLLSFEVSGALLTTAGLGFLGYFLNTIWIPIGDWVGLRTSGKPDLGEMLAVSSKGISAQPWSMFAAGLIVFITILGFSLLGEGLRRRLDPERRSRRTGRTGRLVSRLSLWLEDRWFDPLSPLRRYGPNTAAILTLLAIILGGGYALFQSQSRTQVTSTITTPAGALWASELHDSQATRWISDPGPKAPKLLWSFQDTAGFTGGPVIAADGTLYLAGFSQKLFAVSPQGEKLWEAPLPEAPFGTPAIGTSGEIFVLGYQGSLTAIAPDGTLRWTYEPEAPTLAYASPVSSANGTTYYVTEQYIQAISPAGELVWKQPLPAYGALSFLPRLNGTEDYLLFTNFILSTRDGKLPYKRTGLSIDKFVVSSDGAIYLFEQANLSLATLTADKVTLEQSLRWDPRALGMGYRAPNDAGFTPNGWTWVLYGGAYDYARLLWLDANGNSLTPLDYPYLRNHFLVAIDPDNIAYMCGTLVDGVNYTSECRANRPGDTEPVWRVTVGEMQSTIGGALAQNRLYVTVAEGYLYAFGDK